MDKTKTLKKLFLKTKDEYSEWVQLDNLDEARITLEDNEVVVENEHGTTFPLSDLSTQEVDVFLYVLQH